MAPGHLSGLASQAAGAWFGRHCARGPLGWAEARPRACNGRNGFRRLISRVQAASGTAEAGVVASIAAAAQAAACAAAAAYPTSTQSKNAITRAGHRLLWFDSSTSTPAAAVSAAPEVATAVAPSVNRSSTHHVRRYCYRSISSLRRPLGSRQKAVWFRNAEGQKCWCQARVRNKKSIGTQLE